MPSLSCFADSRESDSDFVSGKQSLAMATSLPRGLHRSRSIGRSSTSNVREAKEVKQISPPFELTLYPCKPILSTECEQITSHNHHHLPQPDLGIVEGVSLEPNVGLPRSCISYILPMHIHSSLNTICLYPFAS